MIIEKWKQSQAYVIGRDHINLNTVCQDRTAYLSENGVHVIALADGAGSRKKSEIGAERVTKTISNLLTKEFLNFYRSCEKRGRDENETLENMKKLKKTILNTLLADLKMEAANLGLGIEELSSTLLFIAIRNGQYIIGHIGDGAIGGLFEEDRSFSVRTLSEPKNGGAPNITFFVTDSDAFDHFRIISGEFTNLRGLILMSDGPAEVMFDKVNGFSENVTKVFENFNGISSTEYNEILKKFLKEKIATFSSDDLSLNILYLESIQTKENPTYALKMIHDIESKDQIIYKSNYCVYLDSTLRFKQKDFFSVDEVRRYIQWI